MHYFQVCLLRFNEITDFRSVEFGAIFLSMPRHCRPRTFLSPRTHLYRRMLCTATRTKERQRIETHKKVSPL